MRKRVFLALGIIVMVTVPAAEAAEVADLANGATAFKKCAICHSVEPGKRGALGPNLAGVVGRKAGSGAFAYSTALKAANIVWTPANLDAFIAKPSAKIKGNRMSFAGLANASERAAIVAYLATKK